MKSDLVLTIVIIILALTLSLMCFAIHEMTFSAMFIIVAVLIFLRYKYL